jgi:hypothetical protein
MSTVDGIGEVYSETYYWGRVIEHGDVTATGSPLGDNIRGGVRAQYVYPAKLYLSTAIQKYPAMLATVVKYAVPYEFNDDMYYRPTPDEIIRKSYEGRPLNEKDRRKIRAMIRRHVRGINNTHRGSRARKDHEKGLELWQSLKTW